MLNSLIVNNSPQLIDVKERDNYITFYTKITFSIFKKNKKKTKVKTKLPDGQVNVLIVEQDEVISNFFLLCCVCICVCVCVRLSELLFCFLIYLLGFFTTSKQNKLIIFFLTIEGKSYIELSFNWFKFEMLRKLKKRITGGYCRKLRTGKHTVNVTNGKT